METNLKIYSDSDFIGKIIFYIIEKMNKELDSDIVKLINDNPTKLSGTYQSKLTTKILTYFKDPKRQIFLGSLYCYLNYHPTKDFDILIFYLYYLSFEL